MEKKVISGDEDVRSEERTLDVVGRGRSLVRTNCRAKETIELSKSTAESKTIETNYL